MLTRDDIKPVVRAILESMSKDGLHNPDPLVKECIMLFSYWGNDIIECAKHLGLELNDGIITEIPVSPTLNHYWDNGEWHPEDETEVVEPLQ